MESSNVIEQFGKLKILVIGDVMIDEYMWGRVERISPEAPIPIVAIEKREERLGGAANVALNIKSLGAEPILCSVIGNDSKGGLFKHLCLSVNIDTQGLVESHHRPTTCKTRIIGHSQHLLRVDDEIDTPLNAEEESKLIHHILSIFDTHTIHAVLFEDYDKGCITKTLIEKVTLEASKRKIPVTVDPKHRNFMNYKNIDLFKPNLKELTIGLKTDIYKSSLLDQLPKLCQKFMEQQNHKAIMVTLSELGMFIINDKELYHIPTQVRDLADVSGAGDTVIATATLCLALGMSLYDIAYISNVAAGIVCEKVGVVPITIKELNVKLN
ncbi:MAG TPA: bifunctional ADP-heptose synthase [Bacteroidales bacterium]|nr:bifunctional ADP-heptose synthase [Bacteroidales bacterium]